MRDRASLILAVIAQVAIASGSALGHPGSGIVADERGNVYISVTGEWAAGLWRIDPAGQVTRLSANGAHWLALDAGNAFARSDLDGWFRRRTAQRLNRTPLEASDGALLQTDGSPMVMNPEGSLCSVKDMELARLSPEGKVTIVGASGFKETVDRLGGIKGLACGEGGTIYATCPSAILSIKPDGKFTIVLHPVTVEDCESYLPSNTPAEFAPYLTGLAVGPKGVFYAAATGCRRVIRILPDGQVAVILKAEAPWSPTGVAVHGQDLYILEYTSAHDDTHEWQPRVRKLAHDGTVTTLLTIPRDAR